MWAASLGFCLPRNLQNELFLLEMTVPGHHPVVHLILPHHLPVFSEQSSPTILLKIAPLYFIPYSLPSFIFPHNSCQHLTCCLFCLCFGVISEWASLPPSIWHSLARPLSSTAYLSYHSIFMREFRVQVLSFCNSSFITVIVTFVKTQILLCHSSG